MNKSFYLRHEEFNWSLFDLEQFLLEYPGLGYSCTKILVMFFNRKSKKTLERVWLSRACRLEHNGTACASCLEFDSVIGPLTGQLTRHVV